MTRAGPALLGLLAACQAGPGLHRQASEGRGFADTALPPAWTRHTVDQGLSGGDGVRLADADQDGDLDVSVGWEESGVSRVYRNPGPGLADQLWPAVDCGPAPQVEDAVMADLDGDGRTDVISSTEGVNRRLVVHFAPSAGDPADPAQWTTVTFPPSVAGQHRWMFAVPLDVDEDGRTDIVAGSKGAGAVVAWLRAPAGDARDPSQWRMHVLEDVGWTMSLRAEDMDGDGDPDLLLSDRTPDAGLQGVRWLENPGPPSRAQTRRWRRHLVGAVGEQVMFLDVHDLDGDGDRDVVVPSRDPNVLRWFERLDGSGDLWAVRPLVYPGGVGTAKAVHAADIDGDGLPDLVLSHANADPPLRGLVWMRQLPGAVWVSEPLSDAEGIKFDRVEAVDLDGDGDPDVLTTEENAGVGSVGLGVIWYENPL